MQGSHAVIKGVKMGQGEVNMRSTRGHQGSELVDGVSLNRPVGMETYTCIMMMTRMQGIHRQQSNISSVQSQKGNNSVLSI